MKQKKRISCFTRDERIEMIQAGIDFCKNQLSLQSMTVEENRVMEDTYKTMQRIIKNQ